MFDFLSLPAELREWIYDHYYSEIITDYFTLLAYKGPDQSLRVTCRLIHIESEEAYHKAYLRFCAARVRCLEVIGERVHHLILRPEADSNRNQAIYGAWLTLARRALPNTAEHQGPTSPLRQI